ncbi:shikimate kinase [Clostridia bacterium]|nr:shikimate kinase [Clostridia bacterium]
MGCGKSRTGRMLSERCGLPFMDLDSFIVRELHMTIPAIFKLRGEEYFRDEETRCLQKLSEYRTMCYSGGQRTLVPRVYNKGHVIALGGGTPLRPENVAVMREHGVCFYINTPFELCYERIRGDGNRPVAAGSTKEELFARFNLRAPFYRAAADFVINGGSAVADYVVGEIMEFLPTIKRMG